MKTAIEWNYPFPPGCDGLLSDKSPPSTGTRPPWRLMVVVPHQHPAHQNEYSTSRLSALRTSPPASLPGNVVHRCLSALALRTFGESGEGEGGLTDRLWLKAQSNKSQFDFCLKSESPFWCSVLPICVKLCVSMCYWMYFSGGFPDGQAFLLRVTAQRTRQAPLDASSTPNALQGMSSPFPHVSLTGGKPPFDARTCPAGGGWRAGSAREAKDIPQAILQANRL